MRNCQRMLTRSAINDHIHILFQNTISDVNALKITVFKTTYMWAINTWWCRCKNKYCSGYLLVNIFKCCTNRCVAHTPSTGSTPNLIRSSLILGPSLFQDDLLRMMSSSRVVAPGFRWRRSRWGRTCPVALKEGEVIPGKPDLSVGWVFFSSQWPVQEFIQMLSQTRWKCQPIVISTSVQLPGQTVHALISRGLPEVGHKPQTVLISYISQASLQSFHHWTSTGREEHSM